MRASVIISVVLCLSACGDTDSNTGTTGTKVTWTTYTNAECTTLPARNSTVTLDTTVACNDSGDGSASNLVCYSDRITYTNHPNIANCSNTGVANTLSVGVCVEFPGPFRTWKLIDSATYNCLTGP